MKTLIYLHGFASSPQSQKAQNLVQWLQENAPGVTCFVPQLPFSVKLAKEIIDKLCIEFPDAVLIGSSLGGFYATYASQVYERKAVLINPAVKSYNLLVSLPAKIKNYYSDEIYTIQAQDLNTLHEMDVKISEPDLLAILLETCDETLDYRHAQEKYRECLLWIEQGGNHRCENFERYLPKIKEFLEF